MSIAINIVEIAADAALNDNAKKINKIILEIGALSGIVPDALQFCYESACKNTIAEGSVLEINTISAAAICNKCDHHFQTNSLAISCPKCGEIVVNISGGRELQVKSINVD
jgi:hydrogenase nickel incorporation protein HypA/HybF